MTPNQKQREIATWEITSLAQEAARLQRGSPEFIPEEHVDVYTQDMAEARRLHGPESAPAMPTVASSCVAQQSGISPEHTLPGEIPSIG
jgi:hypothetical protein